MRPPRFVLLLTGLLALAVLKPIPMSILTPSVLAQAQYVIRPGAEVDVFNFGNPEHARDDSEDSAGGGAWGRVCKTNCTMPITSSATWVNMPDGFRPIRLEVKWRASATFAMFGNDTAEVTATLEANLGNGWSTIEEHTWVQASPACPNPPNGSITCPDHVTVLALAPEQRTGYIQVRAKMVVKMTHCDNCLLRVSNVTGSMSVYDVRVITAPCAYPTNFRQVNAWDRGGGKIEFEYAWDSSSGDLNDLSYCLVGEYVGYGTYPFPSPPFHPSDNPPNPTIINVPANDGGFFDIHETVLFATPYTEATVYAGQTIRDNCGCLIGAPWTTLHVPFGGIARSVSPNGDGSWRFTISKSLVSSVKNPLP